MILSPAQIEVLKHIGRYLFWAILVVIADAAASLLSNGTFHLSPVTMAIATTLLGQIDNFVHNNAAIPANGLAPW